MASVRESKDRLREAATEIDEIADALWSTNALRGRQLRNIAMRVKRAASDSPAAPPDHARAALENMTTVARQYEEQINEIQEICLEAGIEPETDAKTIVEAVRKLAMRSAATTPSDRCVTNLSQQDYDNIVRDAMLWRKHASATPSGAGVSVTPSAGDRAMATARLHELLVKWRKEAREAIPADWGTPYLKSKYLKMDTYAAGIDDCADELAQMLDAVAMNEEAPQKLQKAAAKIAEAPATDGLQAALKASIEVNAMGQDVPQPPAGEGSKPR